MRVKRVERLLRLIQALQSGRSYHVEDIASLTGVGRRTVFRDISLLRTAGIRFSYDPRTRRYSADRETHLPALSLSTPEALALLLATRKLLTHPLVPDRTAATSAALKVESLLPRAIQDYCGPLLDHVDVRPSAESDTAPIVDMLAKLQHALSARSCVWMRYDSYYDRRVIEQTVHPYRLAHIHRGWYVIAYSEEAHEPRTYKVERIIELRALKRLYRIDARFSLDDYFGNAWNMIRGTQRHKVAIRFSKKVAGNVDEILWHKTQRTTHEANGTLLFEVEVDGLDEICWWILGYGDQAEVLEPRTLRRLVAGHAERMRRLYAKDGQPPPSPERRGRQ